MNKVLIEVEQISKETDLAFLILPANGSEVWCPKSVIDEPDDYAEGDEDLELWVAKWWAEKEGLI